MPKTVDDYLAAQPPAARRVLKRVRTVIKKTLGRDTEEVISYGIPAYRQHKRIVVYFAGWKEHFSLYPISKPMEKALAKDLDDDQLSGRGTVRFAFADRLPVHVISSIATLRSREVAAKQKQKPKKK